MPQVLLFDCDIRLVRELASRAGWTVAIGRHADKSPSGQPDPRIWRLIVDDCGKQDNTRVYEADVSELGIPVLDVDDTYWSECQNAHGLRLVGPEEHIFHYRSAPAGHLTLEFHPVDDIAVNLIDFVDVFEDYFQPSQLEHEAGRFGVSRADIERMLQTRTLFVDTYKDTLAELCQMHKGWLFSIDLRSADVRVEALRHLVDRTVPKFWPEVYGDIMRPKRLAQLAERRAEVIVQRRREVDEIDSEMEKELAFYAPYTAMAVTGDEALKVLVAKAFTEVFGCGVTDLDVNTPEGEQKTLDLGIEFGGARWFTEVRSRGDGNLRMTDLERYDEHYARATERHGAARFKMLVFNGMYRQPPETRIAHPPFGSPRVVEEAEDRGISLISVQQLLSAIEQQRNGDFSTDVLLEALKRPGVANVAAP